MDTQAITEELLEAALQHEIRKIGMIWVLKPVLTENLYKVYKQEFSITYYVCDAYT
jgi:hypothetical protein